MTHQAAQSPPQEFNCVRFVTQLLKKLETAFEYKTALTKDPSMKCLMFLKSPSGLTISFQQVPGCVIESITDKPELQEQLRYGMHFYITTPSSRLQDKVRGALETQRINSFTEYENNFIVFCPHFFTPKPHPFAIARAKADADAHFPALVRACVSLGFPVPAATIAATLAIDSAGASETTAGSTLFAPHAITASADAAPSTCYVEETGDPLNPA